MKKKDYTFGLIGKSDSFPNCVSIKARSFCEAQMKLCQVLNEVGKEEMVKTWEKIEKAAKKASPKGVSITSKSLLSYYKLDSVYL